MKNRKGSPLLAVAIVALCFAVGFLAGHLLYRIFGGNCTVTVLETTDVHGNYFDSLYNGTARKCSMASIASYLEKVREEEEIEPVLIDCGDNLQGDNAAFYYNFVDTADIHIVTDYMKYLGYDAVVVGNHDIEAGHSVYDRVCRNSEIPYLAANAVYESGPDAGKPYFRPYTVVERGGIRIAVIGMTNANIKSWLPEEKWDGLDFIRISDIAQDITNEVLEKEKPDFVILAVHSGTGESSDRPDNENEALYLAHNVRGVNLVLCGHDHAATAYAVNTPDGEVGLINAGKAAQNVGRCDIKFKKKKGGFKVRKIKCSLVPMEGIAPDEEFHDRFMPQFEEVKEFACRKIGVITGDLPFEGVLDGPTAYMTLVHTVQLASTGADISISAPLSTRGRIAAGPVTFQDLTKIYVYENMLYVVRMTGRQIKDYLEYSYQNWIASSGPSYNYDSAFGIDYEVSKSAQQGQRVKIKGMSNGESFREDKLYSVAMTSYRASGGGGLLAEGAGINPEDIVIVDKLKDIRSLIGDYIAARKEIAPVVADNWRFVD